MYMNSPGSFHDVMSDLLEFSRMGQIWLSTHNEKYALSTKLKYQTNNTFFLLLVTSI